MLPAGDEVEIISSEVRRLRRQTQPLLAFPQRVLGPLAFGDVRHRAGYPCWYSTFIVEGLTLVEDVNVRAVGPTESVLVSPLMVAATHELFKFVPDSIHVFGMNAVVPVLQPGRQFSRAVTEQRSRSLAPPQQVRLQVNLPERVLSGVGDALQPFFALARRHFNPLLLSDVTLRPPGPGYDSIFLNADQVVQEIFRVSAPVNLSRFDVGQAIPGTPEGAKKCDVQRV